VDDVTPYGKRGFFYETFAFGNDEWHRFQVPATENPRIRPEQLEEEREVMGAAHFAQEYGCEFVDNGSTVFDQGLVDHAFNARVRQTVDFVKLRGRSQLTVDATGVGAAGAGTAADCEGVGNGGEFAPGVYGSAVGGEFSGPGEDGD
jgi:hypothetical protein